MNLQLCFWQFEYKGGEDNGMAKMVRSEEGRGGNKVFAVTFTVLPSKFT